jgi:hypothetical protein
MKGIFAVVFLIVLAAAIGVQLPEIKRYLKIRRM